MRRVLALLGLALAGCYAQPPPPAPASALTGCHPGSYATLTDVECETDADCVLCATVIEPCGVLKRRDQVALTNEPCPAPTNESCGSPSPACCEHRCVRSLGPPAL